MNHSPLAIVLPDIRSAQNVGSILRTADAFGIRLAITCGYTPHLRVPDDLRPPHVITANTAAIAKSALGAELTVPCLHFLTFEEAIDYLQHYQYVIVALEQSEYSTPLATFHPSGPTALVVGNEVTGLSPAQLEVCAHILEIPMLGAKESLNVSVATGIALYQLRSSAQLTNQ
jgi:tRNA G18 (ribose-2'-O)-methylase SpoU